MTTCSRAVCGRVAERRQLAESRELAERRADAARGAGDRLSADDEAAARRAFEPESLSLARFWCVTAAATDVRPQDPPVALPVGR